MMRGLMAIALVSAAILLPGDSWGDDPPAPKQDPGTLFRRIDTNRDGKISRDEFRNFTTTAQRFKDRPEQARGLFERLDANRDGSLSLDEMRTLGVEVSYEPDLEASELPGRLAGINVLVVRGTEVSKAAFEAGSALNLVIRAGAAPIDAARGLCVPQLLLHSCPRSPWPRCAGLRSSRSSQSSAPCCCRRRRCTRRCG